MRNCTCLGGARGGTPWEGGGGGDLRPGVCEALETARAEPADAGEGTRRTGSSLRSAREGGSARERVGLGASWCWEGSYHVAGGPGRVRSRKPDGKD